ncbi:MAG: hypothetical protein ABEJ80_06680 [Halarchaeum sp.]
MSDISPKEVDWDHPEVCPWCGADVEDGGAGFMDHIEERASCKEAFEAWRENVAGDVGGEWSG